MFALANSRRLSPSGRDDNAGIAIPMPEVAIHRIDGVLLVVS